MSEVGSVQLEMKYLSELTGDPIYWKKAEKVSPACSTRDGEGGMLTDVGCVWRPTR